MMAWRVEVVCVSVHSSIISTSANLNGENNYALAANRSTVDYRLISTQQLQGQDIARLSVFPRPIEQGGAAKSGIGCQAPRAASENKGAKLPVGRPLPADSRKPSREYARRKLISSAFGRGFKSLQLHLLLRTLCRLNQTNRRLSISSAVFSCLILSIQDRNQTKKRPLQT